MHSLQDLRDTIRNGIPAAGMPSFHLPAAQFEEVVAYVHALRSPASEHPAPGDAGAGERFFFGNGKCSECHAVRGRGLLLHANGQLRVRRECDGRRARLRARRNPQERIGRILRRERTRPQRGEEENQHASGHRQSPLSVNAAQ